MCGIFGVTNFSINNLVKARAALNTLSHRGPDQSNEYFDNDIYLGHRRLSILDLSENGRQPMVSEDQNIILTVNGEIYNYKSLKNDLKTKYEFRSNSDSEVLLHGYAEWGIKKLLEKIEGMFAFCIYDKTIKKIFLARDRVGIKPLYYSNINKEYCWASELKAITNYYSEASLVYDYTAIYDYLTYLYIPTPKTLYQNIFKLQPGYYLSINPGSKKHELINYWKLNISSNNDTIELASLKIKTLLKESINEQLMSDVPVGFFLSGGIDSGTVVALASEIGADVHTYSIGFSEAKYDETSYAELVANKFKTTHNKKILELDKTIDLFENIKNWYDEPFADTSCFPTFLVSEFAKKKATVVLTGDGGDEVFGGYRWYKSFEKYNHKKFPYPDVVRNLVMKFKLKKGITGKIGRYIETNFFIKELDLYTRLMGGMLNHEKKKYRLFWNIPEDYDDYWYFRKFYRKDLDLYTRLQYLDFHTYLPDDILTKVDRASMAVSLECRVPLLSTALIEYLFSLSPEVRLYKSELKGAMKYTLRDTLPAEIINRDKAGFSIPLKQWKNQLFGQNYYRQEVILDELFKIR